jgi:hypothetical protein
MLLSFYHEESSWSEAAYNGLEQKQELDDVSMIG